MQNFIDLDRYPLNDLNAAGGAKLVAVCRADLAEQGMANLAGFLRPQAVATILDEVLPVLERDAFTHARQHNIYFDAELLDVPPDHPVRGEFQTVNHTICADQIRQSLICRISEWPPMRAFLAAIMGMPVLHMMADPLARVNVMAYRDGEALNWHFDRSEFTTTILLQSPQAGGEFQYRRDLRCDDNPNYDGVAKMLTGDDGKVERIKLEPGTLNVFRGKNTAHKVTDIEGEVARVITVFSYFEEPGRIFPDPERVAFYGRAEPIA